MNRAPLLAFICLTLIVIAIVNVEAASPKLKTKIISAPSIKERMSHIVVLMLENRSFDHMIGFLKFYNPKIDGLNGNETCPYNPQNLTEGYVTVNNNATYVSSPDPDHSVPGTTDQIFGFSKTKVDPPPMNGFVMDYKNNGDSDGGAHIMDMFAFETVPAISTLATQFTTFDRWYASVPGPTQPNRMFFHSATSYGATVDDVEQLALGYPQLTIFDSLSEAGYTWRDYWGDFPSILFLESLRDPFYFDNYRLLEEFADDAANGDLPTYSFIEPRWFDLLDYAASDQHPPHDVSLGESLISYIYDAVRAGPLWNSTLLIVTYDEHGGFFDHVPTPLDGIPPPDNHDTPSGQPYFGFDRLGLRVPNIMVSPWVPKAGVVNEPSNARFEHSSFPGTLKNVFGLSNYLTKRDAWAADFSVAALGQLDAPRTDCPMTVPVASSKKDLHAKFMQQMKDGVDNEKIEALLAAGVRGSTSRITDLQWSMIAIASGLLDKQNPYHAKLLVQKSELQDEHDAAVWMRDVMKEWQVNQKAKMLTKLSKK